MGPANPAGPQPDLGYNANFNGPDRQFGSGWGVSGKIEQGLGDLELVSITAYRKSHIQFDFEQDYLPLDLRDIYARQVDRQFTQEVRLQSSGDRLKWVLGGFYLNSKSGWNDLTLSSVS